MPMRAMTARIKSFAETPGRSRPSTRTCRVRGRRCSRHWVASTCATSLVPMPKAKAPNAPCVLVWLSPHTTVLPGKVRPSSGPITCTMPCCSLESPCSSMPNSAQFASSAESCAAHSRSSITSGIPGLRGVVGVEWSMVASVRPGRRTRRPASRSCAKACGDVTSCTRCRSTYSTAGVSTVSGDTTCASQIFANSVRGSDCATDDLRLRRRLPLHPARRDAVHHFQVRFRAGHHDVGVEAAPAIRASFVLHHHHHFALGVLAGAHADDVEVLEARLDPGDPLDALEHGVDRPVAGGRLVELAAVAREERDGGGGRRARPADRVQAGQLPAAGGPILEETDQESVEVAVVDLLLLVGELLQLLEDAVDLLRLQLVPEVLEPRRQRVPAAVLAQHQIRALEADVLGAHHLVS